MQKTPIKIPGKRTRDISKAAILARKALNRPPGRPLKLPTKDAAPTSIEVKAVKPPKKRSLKNMKSRKKMSYLEKLPTELLEDIFFYCLNIALPRSSPIIGGNLSRKVTYARVVKAAFIPTWYLCYGLSRSHDGQINCVDISRSRQVAEGIPGDPVLQSAILTCRWANLPFLHAVQDEWVQNNALEREVKKLPFIPLDSGVEEVRPSSQEKHEHSYFEADFEEFSTVILRKDFNEIRQRSWRTYVGLAEDTQIPEGLLLGPWTEESIKYLFFLVKSGAKLEWVKSTIGELALLGMKNAIEVGELRVMQLLLWAGLHQKIDTDMIIDALTLAGGDKAAVLETLLEDQLLGGFTHKDANRFWRAADKLRLKAESEGDEKGIAFITQLENSSTFTQIAGHGLYSKAVQK